MSPSTALRSRYSQRFIFIGLIGVVLLASSLSYFYVLQKARERQIDQALEMVASKAHLAAMAHDQWLDESRNLLAATASALERLPDLERDCLPLLAAMAQATRGIDTVLLARPDGEVICAPQPLAGPVNVGDRRYFRRVLENDDFAVGDFIIGRVSGQPVLPVALPLHDAGGALRYVVILGRQLAWVEATLRRQRFPAGTDILLIDGAGNLLAQAPAAAALPAPALLQQIIARGQGVLEAVDDAGRARYFGFTPLGAGVTDAFLLVSVPAEEVLAPARTFVTGSLLQWAMAAALIIVVLWFGLGHWVLRPLRQLLGVMDGVRQGDLRRRVGVEGGTAEMAQIAQSFDQMLQALEQADAQLRRQSDLDGLLGIANRRAFDGSLAHEWGRALREAAPLSLLMIDVDYFKNYNDTYGHQAGDRCLQQIAAAMAAALKRPGDLLARYGGEEFAVLLPHTAAAGADEVARELQDAVARLALPHAASAASAQVTVSIGGATLTPNARIAQDALVHAADAALYRAKQGGRNRCVHHEAVVPRP